MFDSAVAEIEAAYSRLNTGLGWQFLYTPAATISCPTGVMLVGINPGGDEFSIGASIEAGNAYLVESWSGNGAVLQSQVRELFGVLHNTGAVPGISPREALDQTLTTNYCPFRSPRWSELPRREEAVAFSNRFWARLLPQISPRLVLCMGGKPYEMFSALLQREASRTFEEKRWDTGWGKCQFKARGYALEGSKTALAFIPHLS